MNRILVSVLYPMQNILLRTVLNDAIIIVEAQTRQYVRVFVVVIVVGITQDRRRGGNCGILPQAWQRQTSVGETLYNSTGLAR